MLYPYDGIRSMASEYREMIDYIKTLKEENEKLKRQNEKYLKLLLSYMSSQEIEEFDKKVK